MAYTEGQLLMGSDGKPYVVRNGVPVLDMPAGGGMLITKAVTPKDAAETTSAQQRAREAAAAAPYVAQGAADDAQIKHSQAIQAKAKSDEVDANARLATMAPTSGIHGEEYLRRFVPQAQQALVRAYARGDLGSRAGGMSTSMLPIIQHAMNYDPTVSATTFPARVKMQSDLAGNQPNTLGGGLRAMEQMLYHGRDVLRNGAALNNYGPGLIGHLGNTLKIGAEGLADDPRLAAYNQSVNNYAPESQKGVAGSAGVGAEREERHAAYSPTLSQASRAAALQADATMAFDRTGAVNEQYKRLMGKDIVDLLSPDAKKAYDEIMAGGHDAQGKPLHPAPGFTPSSPPTGGGSNGPGGSIGPNTPGASIATGSTRTVPIPAANAIINDGARRGRSIEEVNADLTAGGFQPIPADQAGHYASAVEYAKAHPEYKGGFGAATRTIATTPMERLSASPLATAITSAGNAAFGGLPGALTGTTAQMQAMAALNPKAALAGDIAGSTAGALGTEALLGRGAAMIGGRIGAGLARPLAADATFGAVSGASADPDNPLAGAALGATLAGGGGMFGRGATRALGQAARGVQNGAVNYLRGAGVPLTVGQALSQSGRIGSIAKAFEDKLTSVPVVGDLIKARRLEGMEGFNQAAFDEALRPIGRSTNGLTNEQGVDAALAATGQGYRDALGNVSFSGDAPFRSDVTAAYQKGATAPTYGNDFSAIMKDEVSPIVAGAPTISGDQFQKLDRTLDGYARQYGKIATGTPMVPPSPVAGRVSSAFGDLGEALDGLVTRQAPEVLPAYGAAKGAYRGVKVVQDAVNRARNGTRVGEPGIFAPSQLADAAASNAKTFGGTQGTTAQPFFDLTRAGQAVLPSAIADSGTPGRIAALALPGALGGAAGFGLGDAKSGGEAGAATGVGLGAALALGGTRAGQAAITRAILDRPQQLVRVGNYLVNRSTLGGMFGAGIGTALASQ